MGKDFQHHNPLNWKWGIIYFNKADSRVILPKRNKILGWTLNFAHPLSYVILALIFGAVYILRFLNK